MSAAYSRVLAGQSQFVLITGPAGIGKTRLVEDLTAQAPLRGTLLLSRRVASVAAFNEVGEGGVPNDVVLPAAVIYLPTSSGPSAGSHGYVLPGSVNLTQLAGQISAAMTAGSQLTVEFGGGPAGGVLMLSGAALPFVVLCPAAGVLGEPSGGGGVPND